MKIACFGALVIVTFAQDNSAWTAWKETHERQYGTTEEDQMRQAIYQNNVDYINNVNSQGLTYQLAVNAFTDLTPDEFAATHMGVKRPEQPFGDVPELGYHVSQQGEILADRLDWREAGAVTAIKNQGSCGSCWAFSAVGALEGAWQIATSKLVSMSEQQLVNCAHGQILPPKPCMGCLGGNMDMGLKYATENAICTEESWRYRGWVGMAEIGSCHTKAKSCDVAIPKGAISGYKMVQTDSMTDLMSAANLMPISVAIEADQRSFQSYSSGVLSGDCGSATDHGVLVIGYGTDPVGGDYWLVKNSWAESWGETGTVRIKRGVAGHGECGILSQPCYPIVDVSVTV